jgi:hypothetical protein
LAKSKSKTGKPKPKPKGFNNVAKAMAKKQGEPMADVKAELAASTRKASPAAKKKNPKLKKVK